MKNYRDLLIDVLQNGEHSTDRTGTGTTKVFGRQLRWDLKGGFPMVTGKRVPFKSVYGELLWFISGNTNVKWLQDNGITIWNEWAREDGTIGDGYGHQWRSWDANKSVIPIIEMLEESLSSFDAGEHYASIEDAVDLLKKTKSTIDQLQVAIDTIKNNPDSRRIIVNAWNVGDLEDMALPPCHLMYQFQVSSKGLSLMWTQRKLNCAL